MTKQKRHISLRDMGRYLLLFLCLPVCAQALPVARCVNLDQALEAPNEGDWGFIISRDNIRWIAAQGFDTIRLPVRFNAHWDGQIDPAFLRRVDEVIGWASDDGLQVILDLHHFEELMADPAAHASTFTAIWTELSTHYAGHDANLIFELLNEPTGNLDTAAAVALFVDVMPVIRKNHPNRWVIIEGGDWANLSALPDLPQFDDRTALSFHYYTPYEFTHQLATFVENPPPATTWGTKDDRTALRQDMATAGAVDAPVLLGEFGVTTLTDLDERIGWTTAVRQEAESQGIGWCHWGLSGNFAIHDPMTNDWVTGMKDALFSGR